MTAGPPAYLPVRELREALPFEQVVINGNGTTRPEVVFSSSYPAVFAFGGVGRERVKER
jgi:hypothetical protein